MIVTRFAPSPTGLLHAGNYRTAIFSYLFAKKHGGKFILRIEDTDKERSKKEYEENIIESLKWLNLPYDERYLQSERSELHKEYLHKMVASGHAYVSKETPTKEGGRTEVIRFKNPNKVVTFHDLIRGEISINTTDLGDFVIAKSFDEPLFHLAVVIDDVTMGVTHIVRGEDHISNTPRQMLIVEAIGGKPFTYAHLPLILAPDRSKLSKRKGALPLTEYRDRGYLPEAMLNYLTLLGWNPGTEQELFTHDELVAAFSIERVNKSGAIFDQEKLDWMNHEYIKKLSDDDFTEHAKPFLPTKLTGDARFDTVFRSVLPLLRERIVSFSELRTMAEAGEIEYYFSDPVYEPGKLLWKDTSVEVVQRHLSHLIELLMGTTDSVFSDGEALKNLVWPYAEEGGRGAVLWPMRYALSGKEKSPDPFTLARILGKETTLRRLNAAVTLLQKLA
jgi:glutamyl-tRNA synthetase